MNFLIEHVGKATMKNYKYFVKKLNIDDDDSAMSLLLTVV